MVVKCKIDFDNNPSGVYFAGQVLSGTVTLTADKPKEVRGIALRISGWAHTHWTESESTTVTDAHGKSTEESRTVDYSGREDYLASLTYLMGSEGGSKLTIAPGIHTYSFACRLPLTCPSSYEGAYGHIRYVIQTRLIRPWKFDQTFTEGFTVLKILDLNVESPVLRVPSHSEVQKTFCCGPCRSEPLKLEVNLTQTGFVPGQNIPITVTVTNDSNVRVDEIKVSLMMLVCFYSQTPSKEEKNSSTLIAKQKGQGVLRQCKKQYYYELSVPATPPTSLSDCRILQIGYQVFVEAVVKGMRASQVICVPVTIGNVPLMHGVIQKQPTMMQRNVLDNLAASSNGSMADGVGVSEMVDMKHINNDVPSATPVEQRESQIAPWSADANISPPSYEEATHVPHACINANEKHDYGEGDFAPRYPVFQIPAATAPDAGNDEIDAARKNNGTWL